MFTIRGKEEVGRREGGLRSSAAAPFLSGHHDHTSHQPHICLCPVFKVKIDLVSFVSHGVCNIAEVSWESSQLPQPLQIPQLAPTTSAGLRALQPWEQESNVLVL